MRFLLHRRNTNYFCIASTQYKLCTASDSPEWRTELAPLFMVANQANRGISVIPRILLNVEGIHRARAHPRLHHRWLVFPPQHPSIHPSIHRSSSPSNKLIRYHVPYKSYGRFRTCARCMVRSFARSFVRSDFAGCYVSIGILLRHS
jgi:hypothetical protein